jgi:simple sugar transport system permease protein
VSVASTDTGSAGTTPPTPGPAKQAAPSTSFNPLKRFLLMKEGSIIVVTVVTLIYFLITTPHFFSSEGLQNLLPFFAPYAIIAAAEVFVMINGEIDLSVGGTYLICPFIFNEFTSAHIPLLIAMILAILVCTVVGAINGFFVAYVGINSFVTTLGTLFALYGITLVMSHDTQITTPGTSLFGGGTFQSVFGGGTYSELFWAIGIVVVLQIALSFTKWGIYTVAVGGNRLGAKEAGINEKGNLIRNFMLCAALGAFVGVLEAVRSGSATPDPAQASELLFLVIASAVIGGTLLVGGFGTVIGAMIGALFLGIIQDGLVLKGVNFNYIYLYEGLAILLAMSINIYIARVRVGAGRG